ncbi:hypothetical protein KP509_08G067700 [Ceratopteris richardii]|uniref:PRA1 family protein n=1 Tax=Ceratopteris richardii TaxID=49495 RepID=A0A8T2U6H7_CERRI|nr:hypothetical protein KP509_08G067700 [Ceratopteris richardii]
MAFVANPLSLSIPPANFEAWLRDAGHLEALDKVAIDPPRASRSAFLSSIIGLVVNPFGNVTVEDLCRPPLRWTGEFWDCGNGLSESYGFPLSSAQWKLRMGDNVKKYMGNYIRLFGVILACFLYKLPYTLCGIILVVLMWEGIRMLLNHFKLGRDSLIHQVLVLLAKIVSALTMIYCKVAFAVCWAGIAGFVVMVIHSSLRKITTTSRGHNSRLSR